jgi:formyl-CoA transferase
MTDASDTPGALDGLFVLDLTRILAGPTATQLLGDMGATVIKVENPKTGGDDTRGWGPNYAKNEDGSASDLSAYFMSSNRNKRSIAVDIATGEGQDTVRRLAARADVVVENFKPDGLVKYGLDHATLRAAHPSLVYCSISGYGQTGPNRDKPGYDLMAQGFSGIMSITGDPDGVPTKVGVGIADVMCGMYATIGILTALRHRDKTGEGQHVELALIDASMAWLINEGLNYLSSGELPQRRGNAHPNIVPYDTFEVSDGHFLLAVGNDAQFTRFCDVLGLEEVGASPDFKTNMDRIAHRDALMAHIRPALLTWTKAGILDALRRVKVPAGPINTIGEALTSEQAKARGTVRTMPAKGIAGGEIQLLGNPLKFSATPVKYQRPPPRFGQDTDEVLATWLSEKPPE